MPALPAFLPSVIFAFLLKTRVADPLAPTLDAQLYLSRHDVRDGIILKMTNKASNSTRYGMTIEQVRTQPDFRLLKLTCETFY